MNAPNVEQVNRDILNDFKNVFSTSQGQRVLKNILWQSGLFATDTRPEFIEVKNFGAWLLSMAGGNDVKSVSENMINTILKIPLKGEQEIIEPSPRDRGDKNKRRT